jgi:hypothetical protein
METKAQANGLLYSEGGLQFALAPRQQSAKARGGSADPAIDAPR